MAYLDMDKLRTDSEILLIDAAYYAALIHDINQAQISIFLETYIFNLDVVGLPIANALTDAAKRNVDVHVLVDGAGTPAWGGEIIKAMENAGVKTRVYHPLPWIIWHWGMAAHVPQAWLSKMMYLLLNINSRNHRKTCLIDDKVAYVGSANITASKNSLPWHDISVRVTDADMSPIRHGFEKAWSRELWKKFKKKFRAVKEAGTKFRLNNSWKKRNNLYAGLIRQIKESKKRVWITSAYFIPDNNILKALVRAARRGVDIKIMLPNQSDIYFMKLATRTFYTLLLNENVKVYEFNPAILHAKYRMIDDDVTIGSGNLNNRSFWHDLEIDMTIEQAKTKREIESIFCADMAESTVIQLGDIKKTSWLGYIAGRLVLLGRYWL